MSGCEPRMALQPQHPGLGEGIDACFAPPSRFIAMAMQFAVMAAAERDGELVADLAAERPALGKAQMMGIAGLAAAEEARLLGDEADMLAIADAPRLGMGQHGFVDRPCPRRRRFRDALLRRGIGFSLGGY